MSEVTASVIVRQEPSLPLRQEDILMPALLLKVALFTIFLLGMTYFFLRIYVRFNGVSKDTNLPSIRRLGGLRLSAKTTIHMISAGGKNVLVSEAGTSVNMIILGDSDLSAPGVS